MQWDELLASGAVICGNHPGSCIRQIEALQTKYSFTQILFWTRLSGLEHRKIPEKHLIGELRR